MRLIRSAWFSLLLVLGWMAIFPPANAAAASTSGCRIHPASFDGWNAQEIENDWVQLLIVPTLGGRLMQVSFNGHPYLFINPKTKGAYIPPEKAAGKWINYGGDKVWPMPEGDRDEEHWVLQSSPLDDGQYRFSVLSRQPRCVVRLEGPPDPNTGLQYTRDIGIGADSPEISFHAAMKNVTGHPMRWSIQSVSQYNLADPANPSNYNHDFWIYTPVNPQSAYLSGYHSVDGLVNDPSFAVQDGLFRLNWKYLQNEVWLDSPSGWMAVVDRTNGYSMVERFTYFPGAEYPGKATEIVYKNGPSVELDANGNPRLTSSDPAEDPYYTEAELNSPIVTLQPGASYAMDTEWFPTRNDQAVQSVTYAGMVAKPLSLAETADGSRLTGSFAVFFPGRLEAELFDRQGVRRNQVALGAVSPRNRTDLDAPIALPPDIVRVSLHLIGDGGIDMGSLGETFTQREP